MTTVRALRELLPCVVLALALPACAEQPAVPPPSTPAAPVDPSAAKDAVARVLDELNDAAAHADEARYFALYTDDAVFLGTDGKERWDLTAFRAFAHPYFAKGKAWTFRAVRRAVTIGEGGRIAWFDEDLATPNLGPARGSGVLVSKGGGWKIAQYNLAVVLPNERLDEVRALLDKPAAASALPYEQRYDAAYKRATEAAERKDFGAGQRELSAFLDEATARAADGDDSAFWIHNALTWLRWADGDLLGALAEIDGAKSALIRAHLPEAKSGPVGLHEKWDRAYVLLELALQAPPTLKAKALAAAKDARLDYETAAKPLGDHDGMAVLAAFFAARLGDKKGAAEAAAKVDVDKDKDLQDLYVIALAFDAAGDSARATLVRDRIRAGSSYLMKPLILAQMERDGAHRAAPSAPTPR
jgi:uncharacterized protein (TIGR02246 family)